MEKPDSQVYVDPNMARKNIASFLMFLKLDSDTMLDQNSQTVASRCCAFSTSEVDSFTISSWRAPSSREGSKAFASAVHSPSEEREKGRRINRRRSLEN